MTSHIINGLPTHVELDHDTRGWVRGDIVPVEDWMFVSTASIDAALYPVIDPKSPHTVQAVLYGGWWPAEPPDGYAKPGDVRMVGGLVERWDGKRWELIS